MYIGTSFYNAYFVIQMSQNKTCHFCVAQKQLITFCGKIILLQCGVVLHYKELISSITKKLQFYDYALTRMSTIKT